MSASDYDDTEMTLDEFHDAARSGVPADVSNLGGRVAAVDWDPTPLVVTGATAVTCSETVSLAGNQTIRTTMVLAGK